MLLPEPHYASVLAAIQDSKFQSQPRCRFLSHLSIAIIPEGVSIVSISTEMPLPEPRYKFKCRNNPSGFQSQPRCRFLSHNQFCSREGSAWFVLISTEMPLPATLRGLFQVQVDFSFVRFRQKS